MVCVGHDTGIDPGMEPEIKPELLPRFYSSSQILSLIFNSLFKLFPGLPPYVTAITTDSSFTPNFNVLRDLAVPDFKQWKHGKNLMT